MTFVFRKGKEPAVAFWFKKKRDGAWRSWELPGEVGTVSLPADLVVEMEDESTLLCCLKGDDAINLRMSSISFAKRDSTDENGACSYLKEKAAEDGVRFEEGEDKGFVSYEERCEEDGIPLIIRSWEIGSRNTIVILSATVVESRIGDRLVQDILGLVPRIVQSVKITTIHKVLVAEDREVPIVERTVEPGDQGLRAFEHAEDSWLAENLEYARSLGIKYGSGGTLTPEELDRVFARWMQDAEEKEDGDVVSNALGAAFGEYLVEQHGFRWVVVTDEYGTEKAVRHNIGQTMAFPRASIEKRIEDNEPEVFQNVHVMILAQLRKCGSWR